MDGRSIERHSIEAGRRVKAWIVHPSLAATRDITGIIRWTANRFGPMQAKKYAGLLRDAIKTLRGGPDIAGVRKRDDLLAGLLSLRIHGGSHTLFFKVDESQEEIIVLMRVLHDAMDFARHLQEEK